MENTISVRIPKEELIKIQEISKYIKATKSAILRDVLEIGIKQKMLDLVLDKFQKNEITAWKAARLSKIPLTKFLDILKERKIEFHYGIEELREDFKNLSLK